MNTLRVSAQLSRSNPRKWSFIIMAPFVFGSTSVTSLAHLDPPTSPTLQVRADLLDVTLTNDMDDGIDGNAELLLHYRVEHVLHGVATGKFEIDNLNFDVTPTWTISQTVWTHQECWPRAEIIAAVGLLELDTRPSEVVVSGIASIVRAAASGSPWGAIATGAIPALNGNDDLGVKAESVPENGIVTLQLRGDDGGADVRVLGATAEFPSIECTQSEVGIAQSDPNVQSDELFDPLSDAIAFIPSLEAESGNPANLSSSQVLDLQRFYGSLWLGWAQTLAGIEIEDAHQFEGVESAIGEFEFAQSLVVSGDSIGAVEGFKQAFLMAAAARESALPGADTRLPFQVALAPDFIPMKEGKHVEILVTVLGASMTPSLFVSGSVPGASITVVQDQSRPSIFAVHLDFCSGSVVPGTYELVVSADQGSGLASHTLTVIMNSGSGGLECSESPTLPRRRIPTFRTPID